MATPFEGNTHVESALQGEDMPIEAHERQTGSASAIVSRLQSSLARGREQAILPQPAPRGAKSEGSFKRGGVVPKTGVYKLPLLSGENYVKWA